jgi:hypothetical protein
MQCIMNWQDRDHYLLCPAPPLATLAGSQMIHHARSPTCAGLTRHVSPRVATCRHRHGCVPLGHSTRPLR